MMKPEPRMLISLYRSGRICELHNKGLIGDAEYNRLVAEVAELQEASALKERQKREGKEILFAG